jgi:hypothetical protein
LIRANKKTGREESRRNEKQVEKLDHALSEDKDKALLWKSWYCVHIFRARLELAQLAVDRCAPVVNCPLRAGFQRMRPHPASKFKHCARLDRSNVYLSYLKIYKKQKVRVSVLLNKPNTPLLYSPIRQPGICDNIINQDESNPTKITATSGPSFHKRRAHICTLSNTAARNETGFISYIRAGYHKRDLVSTSLFFLLANMGFEQAVVDNVRMLRHFSAIKKKDAILRNRHFASKIEPAFERPAPHQLCKGVNNAVGPHGS